ncbi:MAG: xanthine dehydrogenase family protein [Alphaproteobacteria bacterium]|nr:xanthine dehydrogenase family protein [Alphaproteobacteria bacterium]
MREITGYVGKPLLRREDRRLLHGEGQFVGDIVLPKMVHCAFVRSQVPHARIKGVDFAAARRAPGFVTALSGRDIRNVVTPIAGMQVSIPKGWRDRFHYHIDVPAQQILADDKVNYVGEAYAVVVAEDRYKAEDAAELVEPDFEVLEPVVDVDRALKPGSPVLHAEVGSNVISVMSTKKGDGAAALARAKHRIKRRYYHHRYAAMPMECRAVVADYDIRTDSLTVWSSTQVVHWIRKEIGSILGMPEERVRVIAPDVGGGFGGKGHVYPEDVLVPYLARTLRRPIKYVEDRFEHLVNSAHARDNFHDLEIGFDDDGKIVCIVDDFVIDSGAYSPVGATCAANSIAHLLGPYDIQNYEAKGTLVATNKTSNAPYRGAGRPEAAFAMERAIDIAANSIGLDPILMRLRNMVPPERLPFSVGLPYRDGVPITYDSGDYPQALRRAVEELGGLENFRRRQAEGLAAGRYLGIGVGCYVEGTGVGPFEGASVRLDPSGKIMVAVGANNHGQGHETVFAQVAADVWNVPIDQVVVTTADTAAVPMGYGTIASRSTVTAGSAVVHASAKVKDKVLAIAANMLETPTADLEFRDGAVGVKGVPDLKVTLKEIWWASRPGWDHKRPPDMEAGLEANHYYEPPTVTWSYATNAAIVELDPDTGRVTVEKFVAVHDAGILVNPLLADGQVRGGLVQGIGAALYEEIAYDENGQILMGTLADYLLPTADDTPPITVIHQEIPSPSNPLGVKGLGEGGAIAPPCAITNAVSDALRPFKAEFNATPVRWEQVRKVFAEAGVSTPRGRG